MITIYCLVNPITDIPFYVGATSRPIHIRLREHLISYPNSDFPRYQLITCLINGGYPPRLITLIKTDCEAAAIFYERFFYRLFINYGYRMLQSSEMLTYSKKRDKKKNKHPNKFGIYNVIHYL